MISPFKRKRGCMLWPLLLFAAYQVIEAEARAGSPADSVVVVSTDIGEGTGFVVTLGGKKYVVTSEHVVRGGKKFISVVRMDGGPIEIRGIDLANDCDLARFHVGEVDLVGLLPQVPTPTIGNPVTLYGNSQGSGVITAEAGKILGVGQREIEIDASIVSGASGGPIVDAQSKVVGVATYCTRTVSRTDWTTQGTRFSETRRFGLRLRPDMRWVRVRFAPYYRQHCLLQDVDTLIQDIERVVIPYYFVVIQEPRRSKTGKQAHRFPYKAVDRAHDYKIEAWAELIAELREIEKRYIQTVRLLRRGRREPKRVRRLGATSVPGLAAGRRLAKERNKAFRALCQVPLERLVQTRWVTQHMRSDSVIREETLGFLAREIERIMMHDGYLRGRGPEPMD